MALIDWNEELSLGIPRLDEQHRWLANGINALHEEVSRPMTDRARQGEVFEALVDYLMNHFILEEEILRRHGVRRSDAHLAEHHACTSRIVTLLNQFQHDGADVGHEIAALLRDWLSHHILVLDKHYVPFFRTQTTA